jgi:hypothetical protein
VTRTSLLAFSLVLIAAAPSTALAWQTVHAGPNGAKIHSSSSTDSDVVGTVPAGKAITIGDRPTNGLYRANGGKGLTGWAEEGDLDFGAKGKPHPTAGDTANATLNKYGVSNSGQNIYIGALLGFAFASGGSKFEFGLDGNYKLSPEWGIGLYGTYSSTSQTVPPVAGITAGGTASASSIIIAPELNYFLQGELKGLHLGGKIGLNMISSSSSIAGSTGGSTSNLAFGAGAGYDYPIAQSFTIGGEANFLIISSGSSSSGSGSTTVTTSGGSTSVFNILAAGKYWF